MFNDLWTFSLDTLRWTPHISVNGIRPDVSSNAALFAIGNQLYLHGGGNLRLSANGRGCTSGKLRMFDLLARRWYRVRPRAYAADARCTRRDGHSATVLGDGRYVVITGGYMADELFVLQTPPSSIAAI